MKLLALASTSLLLAWLASCHSADPSVQEKPHAPAPIKTVERGAPSASTEGGVDVAAINKPFENLTADEVRTWVGRFERDDREIYRRRVEIVQALSLRPGMRVADVGAGTGLFEACFAQLVGPTGRVYAVDIAQPFLDWIRERALRDGLENVEPRHCDPDCVPFTPGAVDLVFLCDTYHHFEHPQQNLASIREALAPDGALVVVDFEKEPGKASDFVMHHVRAPKAAVKSEIEAAGFAFEREIPLLQENYVLLFRIRAESDGPAGRSPENR